MRIGVFRLNTREAVPKFRQFDYPLIRFNGSYQPSRTYKMDPSINSLLPRKYLLGKRLGGKIWWKIRGRISWNFVKRNKGRAINQVELEEFHRIPINSAEFSLIRSNLAEFREISRIL